MNRADHPRRCTALLSDRSRRCLRYAVKGTNTCPTHGASAPQVKRTARQRLTALAEPAITALSSALELVERNPQIALHPGVQRAALAVLDRSGYHPRAALDIDAKITEEQGQLLAAVLRDLTHTLAPIYNFDPYAPKVVKAMRLACEAAYQASDGGVRFDEGPQTWLAHATPEERLKVVAIMEACEARRAGREVESLVPEATNGHAPAPPPEPEPETMRL